MNNPLLLTETVLAQIEGEVLAGAYLWVAAESVGISQGTLANWLSSDAPACRELQRRLMIAQAKARAGAEKALYAAKPDVWLLKGQGRERPGRPGWSNEARVEIDSASPLRHLDLSKLASADIANLRALLTRAIANTGEDPAF